MGTILSVYSESDGKFYRVSRKIELDIESVRKIRSSKLRYCLGDNMLYLPQDLDKAMSGCFCWARIRTDLISDFKFEFVDGYEGDGELVSGLVNLEAAGVRIGDRYVRRWKEENGRFVPVPEFCSQMLIDGIANNPEAIETVDSTSFEELCAEIFVRRGFKVDLFRRSGDGGIDFIALQDDRTDPLIFAVQVKQPHIREGKNRRSVGRPVIQQIYGAAKAWDLTGGIVISGSTYSAEAKNFVEIKPDEMKIYDSRDILEWISQFRWNEDELIN